MDVVKTEDKLEETLKDLGEKELHKTIWEEK